MNILLYTPLTIYLHAQQHAMQGARLQARDSPNDKKQTNKTIKKKKKDWNVELNRDVFTLGAFHFSYIPVMLMVILCGCSFSFKVSGTLDIFTPAGWSIQYEVSAEVSVFVE